MIRGGVRQLLVRFPSVWRVYDGFLTVRWWHRRRRSALSWTETYLPVSSYVQRGVPARPFADTVRRVTEELGRTVDEVFHRLDPQPISCGPLSQIHRGQLKDGRVVVVKVPHPGFEKRIGADIRVLGGLLRILARVESTLDLRPAVDELLRAARQDLDYVEEGRNAERVAECFAGRSDVRVPAVDWEHTTPRLLVMDLAEGIPVSEVDDLRAAGIDPGAVARLIADVYCQQISVHGFFHADPHPGNLLVQPGPRVTLLDFGLFLDLDDNFRLALARLLKAMADRDPVALLPAFEELGIHTLGGGDQSSVLVLGRVFSDLLRLGGYAKPRFRAEADERIARAVREDPVTQVPAELLLLLRGVGLLGWLTGYLGSTVDLLEAFYPYTRAVVAEAA